MIHEKKVKVVDSIMGSGKTTAALEYINNHQDTRFIFCSPYLAELERANQGTGGRLVQPVNRGEGKLESFHRLLARGEDIAVTHQLFMDATEETMTFIREGEYSLILDETLDVLQKYEAKDREGKKINEGDYEFLIKTSSITVDDHTWSVHWTGAGNPNFHYSEIKRMAESNSLLFFEKNFYWLFPIEMLDSFQEVIVLTYLFEASMLSAHLRMNDIPYEKYSVGRNETGGYELFADFDEAIEIRREIARHIDIYDGNRNDIRVRGLSHNRYSSFRQEDFRIIRNSINAVKRQWGIGVDQIMWTCPKEFQARIECKGFTYIRRLTSDEKRKPEREINKLRCFVSQTARATNDFSQRKYLFYLSDRHLNPETVKFLDKFHCNIDGDLFATSELVQWIWRSAIRNGEDIKIYIPSRRMRSLLKKWLNP